MPFQALSSFVSFIFHLVVSTREVLELPGLPHHLSFTLGEVLQTYTHTQRERERERESRFSFLYRKEEKSKKR
ncbi:hypothetical protein BY458DRAFT_502831 [Sporodiniella umbellata]|nr:hypothetical protein BY458DRAFT_502831 [Sporodiniella umbellata]